MTPEEFKELFYQRMSDITVPINYVESYDGKSGIQYDVYEAGPQYFAIEMIDGEDVKEVHPVLKVVNDWRDV